MRSHEAIKHAADKVGVKSLAASLRLSQALIYKWCQESDPNDPDTSGARNPLDRLAEIVHATDDTKVVEWLCHQANGFYVPNAPTTNDDIPTQLLVNTQQLVNEFSQLLMTVTKSIEDDGEIEPSEAERIRQSWQQFKSTAEAFTLACEQGRFHNGK